MIPVERFCPHCEKLEERRIECRKETIAVRGEPIEVDADVAVCVACGQDIADMELDEATLERAYNMYRRRHTVS